MIDRIAAYWDARPCNVRHSNAPVGSLEYSEQVTWRKWRAEPHLWRFAYFAEWRGKDVLDAGCGIGTVALEFAHYGARVVGVDVSARSFEIAEKRAEAERLPVRFMRGSLEDAWLPPMFDLIWCWGVLHHTPHPDKALANFRRWLKPGGVVRAMVYHRLSTKALRLWLRAGCPRDFDSAVARGSEAQPGCPLTRTYTKRSARRLFEDAGFTVTRCDVTHIFPWRVPDYVRGEFVRGWPWRVLPERWLERWLGWHILVEARV
jgi:SAM-dependent methyltransferase